MRLRELASCHTFRATGITAYLLNGARVPPFALLCNWSGLGSVSASASSAMASTRTEERSEPRPLPTVLEAGPRKMANRRGRLPSRPVARPTSASGTATRTHAERTTTTRRTSRGAAAGSRENGGRRGQQRADQRRQQSKHGRVPSTPGEAIVCPDRRRQQPNGRQAHEPDCGLGDERHLRIDKRSRERPCDVRHADFPACIHSVHVPLKLR